MLELDVEMTINRENKDSMFRELFLDKEKLLNLYNAINQTNYTDINKMQIATLKQVLYMGKKNDISFIYQDRLIVFIEHQSTINGNMAVRLLRYAGLAYETLLQDDDLYGTRQSPIPRPEFYVFYNGQTNFPMEETLRLSDGFIDKAEGEQPLEVVVKIININYHLEGDILERSKDLKNYSYFIHLVNKFQDDGRNLDNAIELAILTCMEQDILADFLKKHGSEVMNMLDWSFEKVLKARLKESHEEGLERGLEEGLEKGLEQGLVQGLEQGLEQGLKQGKHNKAIEMAKKGLENNIPLETVSLMTGFTLLELEKLAQDM